MAGGIPFRSPETLRREFTLPNLGRVVGMGVPKGVTLIVGGGFHGKSTLLRALERRVYNHVPGDGRELVVTDPTAVKIRAEDGRSVAGVDIWPFISGLPGGLDTREVQHAKRERGHVPGGEHYRSAGVGVQCITVGRGILGDELHDPGPEDGGADREMRHEPITPFLDRVRQMYSEHGVVNSAGDGRLGRLF